MTLIAGGEARQIEKTGLYADKSSTYKSWFKSASIFAMAIFLLLNALPLIWNQEANVTPGVKLKHFVENSIYESRQQGTWPWWVARAYFKSSNPDIAAMGDSQLNAAFIQADSIALNKPRDCVWDRNCFALKKQLQNQGIYSKSDLQLINLSLGGAMPSDYYLMSKCFFSKEKHPKLVIISISPRSFLDATLSSASSTETFQFLSYYADLGNLVNYAFSNPVEQYFWWVKNNFLLFRFRQDINLLLNDVLIQSCDRADKELFHLGKAGSVLSPTAVQAIYGTDGLVSPGSNVVTPNPNVPFRGNMKEYEKRFSQLKTQTLEAQSAYFLATLKYLKEIGVKTIVVDMPMLQPVRDLLPKSFWSNYSGHLKAECSVNDAYWYELAGDPNFSQADFLDYVHLNAYGGQKFVESLAHYIGKTKTLN